MTSGYDPWGMPNPSATPAPQPMPEPDGSDCSGLIKLLQTQRDLLVGVARHEITFKDRGVDDAYKERARRIRKGLAILGHDDPFPYRDLRDWYNFAAARYGTWRERERYVDDVLYSVTEALEATRNGGIIDWGTEGPANWAALDKRIEELRAEFASASTLDTYQDVGRRSVEIIIGAVNLVWDAMTRPDSGPDRPKGDDAKAKFDIILRTATPGGSYEELRQVLRAAWRLGHDTKHSGHASRLRAFTSAQAAVLIARSLREIQAEMPTETA